MWVGSALAIVISPPTIDGRPLITAWELLPDAAGRSRPGASSRDIGGTFTDVILEIPGRRTALKELTTPAAPERAVLEGIERVLSAAGLSAADVGPMMPGTTLATNAVIERRGAATALITTEGFRDVLAIADEGRFNQYDINLAKTEPLVQRYRRLVVPERTGADGEVLIPLDEAAVRAAGDRRQPARSVLAPPRRTGRG